ncbi:hypothetical protein GUJ93_ZPchr0002g23209 [Zizania palustris]|uniref:Uncharacterized protein n=1 Tax=Zizania palustris TaxID=103762 RepID=A0A8J5RJN6_ZIZPA|nr:hypothetical protein GUJ93_ZPchr0002g23209 [Zizania palustris]
MHEASCQLKKHYDPDGSVMLVDFGSINFQLQKKFQNNFQAKATNDRWYSDWILRWFYAEVGADSGLPGPSEEISY